MGLFSQIDVPRGHMGGYSTFPWGLNLTVQSFGILKHVDQENRGLHPLCLR